MNSKSIRRVATTACVAIGVSLLAACNPPSDPPGTTTTTDIPAIPTIHSFSVAGYAGDSPAVVALTWNVSDANGDQLTCSIDANDDGTDDVVVAGCNGTSSRNVTYPTSGVFTARFRVSDGSSPTVQTARTVTVGAGPSESYDLVLRGTESLSSEIADAFAEAEDFWESAIVRGTTDFAIAPRPGCLDAGAPDLPSVIDDVIIDVRVGAIDGVDGILGQAGPSCFNTSNDMPLVGLMEFDEADVAVLGADRFRDVVLHEMGHVLGIGTLWDTTGVGGSRKVISGAGSSDPTFTGVRAVAEWAALGGSGKVPVEATGGVGTADSHWRETTFANELMTGWLNLTNPASMMTIASLADLGYHVDLAAADSYSLPSAAMRSSGSSSTGADIGTVLRPPVGPA